MDTLKVLELKDIVGIHRNYQLCEDDMVRSRIICGSELQGHIGVVHGGVVAFIFDAAMGNCMFAHKLVTLTAGLEVKFIKPMAVEQEAEVITWISRSVGDVRVVNGIIRQNEITVASAEGKFVIKQDMITEELAKQHRF